MKKGGTAWRADVPEVNVAPHAGTARRMRVPVPCVAANRPRTFAKREVDVERKEERTGMLREYSNSARQVVIPGSA